MARKVLAMSRIKVGLAILLAFVLCLLADVRDPFMDGGLEDG